MLCCWAENMMAASYGFQTYVLLLAARAPHEAVRRSLLENAWEELGDVDYPRRSHYNMVCELSKKICLLPQSHLKKPRLLPSSVNHVETHIERCKSAPFLQSLGMIYLVEALTRIEFTRVLAAFVRWYPLATSRKIEEFALKGGVSYFAANIEADLKHQQDVETMIELTIASDPQFRNARSEDYLSYIEKGIIESLACRDRFTQGVYDSTFNPNFSPKPSAMGLEQVSVARF
jgi:pyrroloquinoline quinone (PQQ) biosynthesis protein C